MKRMHIDAFNREVAIMRNLTGEAKRAKFAELQAIQVFDVNEQSGKEFDIDVNWVKDVDPNVSEEKSFTDDAEQKAANAAHVKSRRIVPGESHTAARGFVGADGKAVKRRSGGQAAFVGDGADEKAYRWGAFALACRGNSTMKTWLGNEGYVSKSGLVEYDNSRGGVLVPEVLIDDLIDLRLKYGVFRQEAYHVAMSSDSVIRPRRVGGVTASFVGEAQAIASSIPTFDKIQLVAKKVGASVIMSSEVDEDSIIDLGQHVAKEIAYAFSQKEDLCGFVGDGTSTYGGIVGIVEKLIEINGLDNGGGLVLAAGNAWGEVTLANLMALVAALPDYAGENAKWYVNKSFWGQVMLPIAMAAGGVSASEIVNGVRQQTFLGYPVVTTNALAKAQGNSQVPALFGDLTKSSTFGTRRDVRIEFFNQGTVDGVNLIDTDQVAYRGTERFDIVNHELGTATEPGAIVGLITAAA